jgi:uncharacterized membrane protein
MKLLKFAFRRETAMPMLAITFASGVSVALVLARMVWARRVSDHAFLIWNLFLAWMPLLFALLACREFCENSRPTWKFRGLTAAWLLFFPNAPYIFTDLTHLTTRFSGHFWVDMVLILSCAFTGLVVGFLSLFLMQSVVARVMGRAASWLFVAAVAGLSGFGIYVGRFLRFNSWDIVYQPLALCRGVFKWAADPLSHSSSYAFPVLFATFLFIAYLMLYAFTHLPRISSLAAPQQSEE